MRASSSRVRVAPPGFAHSNARPAHQFQSASLELERTRRVKERQTAMARMKTVEARLIEIDAAIRKHHDALGLTDTRPDQPPAASGREAQAATTEKRRALRY